METVLADLDYPNGLSFVDDELYVAHTNRGKISRHRPGVGPSGPALTLSAGGPDGIAVGADGHLYIATPDADAVAVFDAEEHRERHIRFDAPTFPTNLCFAGTQRRQLVVTAAKGGRVLSLDLEEVEAAAA